MLPVLTDEQRAIANQYARFALQFATAIGFAPKNGPATNSSINTATISLIRLCGRQFGITNQHVLAHYQSRSVDEELTCQIGNVIIDPVSRLHSESELLDLAVLDLSGVDSQQIRSPDSDIPCQFHESRRWPPETVKVNEFVALGGFPMTKRVERSANDFELGGVCSGGSRVISVQDDVITCQFNIDECIVNFDRDGRGFEDVAGMSGGPVFLPSFTSSGIEVMDLVGFIFEYHNDWDVLRFRPSSLISEAGYVVA